MQHAHTALAAADGAGWANFHSLKRAQHGVGDGNRRSVDRHLPGEAFSAKKITRELAGRRSSVEGRIQLLCRRAGHPLAYLSPGTLDTPASRRPLLLAGMSSLARTYLAGWVLILGMACGLAVFTSISETAIFWEPNDFRRPHLETKVRRGPRLRPHPWRDLGPAHCHCTPFSSTVPSRREWQHQNSWLV